MKPAMPTAPAPTRERYKVVDNSSDKKYFTMVPRIIWALSRTNYDLTFWMVVKEIAGEHGECRICRDDLAKLCMMSTGKTTDCRDFWFRNNCLEGRIERDPDYPQPVWHLTVPDVWERNIDFVKQNGLWTIKGRIKYKTNQVLELRKEPSPGDEKEPSPGDGGVLSGDRGISPGDGGVLLGDGTSIEKENPPNIQNKNHERVHAHSLIPVVTPQQLTAAARTELFINLQPAIYREVVGRDPVVPINEHMLLEFFIELNKDPMYSHPMEEIIAAYKCYLADKGPRGYFEKRDWELRLFLEAGNFSEFIKRAKTKQPDEQHPLGVL